MAYRQSFQYRPWTSPLSPKEQEEEQEMREDERRTSAADDARETTAVADLRIALTAAGCAQESIGKLVLHRYRFDEWLTEGKIQFTDRAKANKVKLAFAVFTKTLRNS